MATSQRARWFSNSLTILVFSFLILLFSGCDSSPIPGEAASDLGNSSQKLENQVTTTPIILPPKVDDDENIPVIETPITSITPEIVGKIVGEDEPLNQNIFVPLLDFPIPESGLRSIETTYRFGSTLFGERIPHDGVEMLNPLGTPVLAAEDGIVFFSGNDRSKKWGRFTNFYGNFIIIQHQINEISQPIYTLYAHLSELLVQEGDAVSSGQTIGLVGATGKAFTNHLHFEVRVGDFLLQNARNPELYLPLIPTEDQPDMGILIGSLISQKGNPISGISVVIQRVLDGEIQRGSAIYIETYAKVISGDQDWQENFVASNLPAGDYRVSAFAYQYFVEKYITIKPNEFVHVILQPEE